MLGSQKTYQHTQLRRRLLGTIARPTTGFGSLRNVVVALNAAPAAFGETEK